MRRLFLLPLLIALCALGLVACGSDSGDSGSGAKTLDRLDAVSISGDVGSAPKVTWKGPMSAGKIETKTLVAGKGATVASGDSVLAQIYIGNGFTEKQAYSTWTDKMAQVITVDGQLPQFLAPVEGATIGSRLVITASADEAFGDTGNPSLGIGNKDPIVVVVDLVSSVLKNASGTRTTYPAWMPHPITTKGTISGFDFSGAPAPDGTLKSVAIAKGDGPVVTAGQTIVVHYLGQVFGGAKPFDQNFDSDPSSFAIGTGGVIKGWDQVLVGQTVGSRVVMEVPPDLAYGSAGNTQAGITGTDTLVFVVDILGAG